MRVKDLIKDDKGKICGLILRDELTGKMDSCPGSTTVEQLTLYPKIEGSNPAPGTGNWQKKLSMLDSFFLKAFANLIKNLRP